MTSSARMLVGCFVALMACGCHGRHSDVESSRVGRSSAKGSTAKGIDTASGITIASLEKIPRDVQRGKNFAVVIGINNYPPRFTRLRRASNDARSFRKVLIDQLGYTADTVLPLENERAGKQAIQDALTRWLDGQQLREEDSVMLFFAGHGERGYLAAADSDKDDVEGTWLSMQAVVDRLKELPCRQKLVVLDCCYAGRLFWLRDNAVVNEGPAGTKPRQRNCFLGIVAGDDTVVADEFGEGEHSLFTGALLQSIEERAGSEREDGTFLGHELAIDVARRVSNVRRSPQEVAWGYLSRQHNGYFVFRPTQPRKTLRQLSQERARRALVHQYASDMLLAWQAVLRGDQRTAIQLLKRYETDSISQDVRDFSWRLIKGQIPNDMIVTDSFYGEVYTAAIDNYGRYLAAGGAYLSNWNPQHRYEAYDKWQVIDRRTGEELFGASGHAGYVESVAYSPDGKLLAIGRVRSNIAGGGTFGTITVHDGAVDIVDVTSGVTVRTIDVSEPVLSVTFSPDGRFLAVGGGGSTGTTRWRSANGIIQGGETLLLVEVSSGKAIGRFKGHFQSVTAVKFTLDGAHLVSGSEDGTIKVWNVDTRECDTTLGQPNTGEWGGLEGDIKKRTRRPTLTASEQEEVRGLWFGKSIESLDISDNGEFLAFGWRDGNVEVCRFQDLSARKKFKVSQREVNAVALSPDGSLLAAGCQDRFIYLVSSRTGEVIKVDGRHSKGVLSLDFIDDGESLLSTSMDGTIRITNVSSALAAADSLPHAGTITDIAFSATGDLAATVGSEETVRIWETKTGRLLGILWVFADAAAFSPDGETLALKGNHDLTLWDCRSLRLRCSLNTNEGSRGSVIRYTTDGRYLVQTSWRDVIVWDTSNWTVARRFKAHDDAIVSLELDFQGNIITRAESGEMKTWLCDGSEIAGHIRAQGPGSDMDVCGAFAAVSSDDKVSVWDCRNNSSRIVDFQRGIQELAIAPDGRTLATSSSGTGMIQLWNVEESVATIQLTSNDDEISKVSFSPDGACLMAGGRYGSVHIWNSTRETNEESKARSGMPSGMSIDSTPGESRGLCKTAVSLDGSCQLLGYRSGKIDVWRSVEKGGLCSIQGHTRDVLGLAVSSDGLLAASSGCDRTVKLWDLSANQLLDTLRGYTGWVTALAFMPTGEKLVSADANGNVMLWNTSTRQRVGQATTQSAVSQVVFSADGSRVAVVGFDMHVYDAASLKEVWASDYLPNYGYHGGEIQQYTAATFAGNNTLIVGLNTGAIKYCDLREGSSKAVYSGDFAKETGQDLLSRYGKVVVAKVEGRGIRSVIAVPRRDMGISCDESRNLCIWVLSTGKVTSTVPLNEPAGSLVVNSRSDRLEAWGDSGQVGSWSLDELADSIKRVDKH